MGLKELREIESIGFEDFLFPNQAAVIVHLRMFHSGGRTPRRSEQLDTGPDRRCGWDIGQEILPVAGNGEFLHGEIARTLVMRIPLGSVIARPDWQTRYRKSEVACRIEKLTKNFRAVLFTRCAERDRAEFIKAAAETLPLLVASLFESKIHRRMRRPACGYRFQW